ncbi:MAG: tetratricopeptide repeat protein [Anaerolineae bacterium]|nr:tetratricopeptide repeat protein [Anaerolineae bacterium]
MDLQTETSPFFQAGGALPLNAVYVERPADQALFQATIRGEYCNVLTPRQMGKSSLMVRTADRLRSAGVCTAILDLTDIGADEVSAEEWYFGLISSLKQRLGLAVDERRWWSEHTQKGAVQRFSDFLRDVILTEITQPVVVFIDEIDSTLSLPFADDFFTAIRAAYNARASESTYKRLAFVLLGVARPTDLIKNRSRTPYNVGLAIDLTDFSLTEAGVLLPGLATASEDQAETVMRRVLYWTGGHPYLTQKVCATLITTHNDHWVDEQIDTLVKRLFLSDEARKESNLQYIGDRIRESNDREKLLQVYDNVLANKSVIDEERDPIKSQLKIIGLLKVTPQGNLIVRNRIYEAVFDLQWVRSNMPKVTSSRVTLIAAFVIVIALAFGGVLFYRLQNSEQIQAQTYTQNFIDAQSAAVRITSLAGLFQLGGQFEANAHKMFFALAPDQQLALFTDLAAPEQIAADLLTVIKGVYTHLENTNLHNDLLQAMVDNLNKIEDAFPDSRLLNSEIKAWLEGRQKTQSGENETAIAAYNRAINYNDQNPGVYLDRAIAYTQMEQYNEALVDLNDMLELDPNRQAQVANFIQSNPALNNYLESHQNDFPTLVDLRKG